ncbi:unnamed protein product [Larinioides sclopetarius]|uniref:Uncharacterized protein n=1 Tax=Larinioides sclopetarius TaxID=280406 RepID=A0AAV2A7Y6_9ARAC
MYINRGRQKNNMWLSKAYLNHCSLNDISTFESNDKGGRTDSNFPYKLDEEIDTNNSFEIESESDKTNLKYSDFGQESQNIGLFYADGGISNDLVTIWRKVDISGRFHHRSSRTFIRRDSLEASRTLVKFRDFHVKSGINTAASKSSSENAQIWMLA